MPQISTPPHPQPPHPAPPRRSPPAVSGARAAGSLACLGICLLAGSAPEGRASAQAMARPPVNAVPVATLAQLSAVLTGCWVPPAGSEGSEITFRFGLTATGELRGKPLASYSVLTGPPEVQRAFVAAAILALSRCTPVRMTEQLARIAASRVLTLRFASGERRT